MTYDVLFINNITIPLAKRIKARQTSKKTNAAFFWLRKFLSNQSRVGLGKREGEQLAFGQLREQLLMSLLTPMRAQYLVRGCVIP